MSGRKRTDGCTGVPDIAWHCCELHDARYRGILRDVPDRKAADDAFFDCLMGMGRRDEWYWRPFWWAIAWGFWAGVRIFGARAWREGRAFLRKE